MCLILHSSYDHISPWKQFSLVAKEEVRKIENVRRICHAFTGLKVVEVSWKGTRLVLSL